MMIYLMPVFPIRPIIPMRIDCITLTHRSPGTGKVLHVIVTIYWIMNEHCRTLTPSPHYLFSSVQFSRSVVSNSLRPHESQHSRPPCPSPTPGVHSDSCPSSRWCHQPSHPLSSPSPPAPNPSQHQGLFQWVSFSHGVAKVLEFQLQGGGLFLLKLIYNVVFISDT